MIKLGLRREIMMKKIEIETIRGLPEREKEMGMMMETLEFGGFCGICGKGVNLSK